jgi:hypothetical protein
MKNTVTRDDVEKALWIQSAWQIEEVEVEAIMELVDQYAGSDRPTPAPADPTVKEQSGTCAALADRLDEFARRMQILTEALCSAAPEARPSVVLDIAAIRNENDPRERQCRVCDRFWTLEIHFSRDAKGKSGYKTVCKDCDNVRKRTSRQAKASLKARSERDARGRAA